ncbi:MAG: hypothetical protein ACLPH3_07025 [Terracidiphilus sp.]
MCIQQPLRPRPPEWAIGLATAGLQLAQERTPSSEWIFPQEKATLHDSETPQYLENRRPSAYNASVMAKAKEQSFEVACPDCGAMIKIDAATGLVVSHTPAPRKRMFEDLETAAKAMREQDERKESIFRQSVDAERNKADLLEKKFAEAIRKAKDAPEGRPLREFDLD